MRDVARGRRSREANLTTRVPWGGMGMHEERRVCTGWMSWTVPFFLCVAVRDISSLFRIVHPCRASLAHRVAEASAALETRLLRFARCGWIGKDGLAWALAFHPRDASACAWPILFVSMPRSLVGWRCLYPGAMDVFPQRWPRGSAGTRKLLRLVLRPLVRSDPFVPSGARR
eukprot:scaffold1554_cov332-Pavlova_lutheri.AAC.13